MQTTSFLGARNAQIIGIEPNAAAVFTRNPASRVSQPKFGKKADTVQFGQQHMAHQDTVLQPSFQLKKPSLKQRLWDRTKFALNPRHILYDFGIGCIFAVAALIPLHVFSWTMIPMAMVAGPMARFVFPNFFGRNTKP